MSEETSTPEATESEAPELSLLAREAFGNKYYGEVKEPERRDADEPEEGGEQEEQPEEQQEQTQETEEAQGAEEGEESGEVTISSVQELIEASEYDPEWFNSLEIDVKVDGQPSKAKLSDLVSSYQIQTAAEKRLEEAKEKAKTQNQALAEKQEQIDRSFQVAANLIKKVESKLTSDSDSVDWKTLREQDPAEFAAKKQEFEERKKELEKMKQEAVSEYQQVAQTSQAEQQEQLQQYLQAEREKLLSALPEWKDEEKAKEASGKISGYLSNIGFSNQEIAQAYDHRMVLMAHKAMLYDEGQGKAEPAKKKLAKVPKTLKPGAPKSPTQINQQKARDAMDRLKRTGSLDDALAAYRMRKGET